MKYLNYILIITGAVIAMYAKTGIEQNQYILIGGIIMLMLGVYRISRTIPSKQDKEEDIHDSEIE
ncbi:hypothetical protein A8C32_04385 [Flavivirga aquatica]|uniref:Uncharacterized protein n=2 Tax=Flavivirga aquatica TaxID=1849968 RepID=A0A1E5SH67_9FLAO|nr:hypothetical protein A8C32_04385 [Flavivirga aquatica]